MAFTTAVWKVEGSKLVTVSRTKLDSEKRLEDWLAEDLSLLDRELLLIGRQVPTPAGRIDLLALDENGVVVVIELKKHKTPREVVAEVLDYGSWVVNQGYERIAARFAASYQKPLPEVFHARFEAHLPEDPCSEHELVIVASELDDSSERIVNYLFDKHELAINVVFFNVFKLNDDEIVTRSWLTDPEEIEERVKKDRPWTGLYFVNTGMDHPNIPISHGRHWANCREFGYLSSGGDPRFWQPLQKLQIGDKVMAYVKQRGYVGYGEVSQLAEPAHLFLLPNGKRLSDVVSSHGKGNDKKNEDGWEWVVGIKWIKTFSIDDAKWFKGAFAKPRVVSRILQPQTIEYLTKEFGIKPMGPG